MAYDCYFASVMQAEFLEQGASFYLVSHRESIYGCRRHCPCMMITPRLTFIASGCGCGERAWGLEIFLVLSIYKTRLTCWSRSGASGLGRRIIFPLITFPRWNNPSYVDYLEKCPKHPRRRCGLKFSFKEAVSLESRSLFYNYYLYLSAVEVDISD